ncbi:type III secretory pathway apparatus protein [Oleiphilus messinensis]|uniref:Type III secretory pathway apparatus protein n=1 Tax=Oleiphilus messinensis TaxID=141451 RepID=A0A1Y0IJ34_9GAMM|nr:type III secretion system export apparatus subunit SctR [Oleiphilus messinensis]ARU59443.1 type III secretory pathway apparatus protein [Oleiphilus messinensis]
MELSSLTPGAVIAMVVGLSMAPFVAVMVTSFTKIVVVLSLLRNALGLQQVPPNVVINGLAIILSIYVMYPVMLETNRLVTDSPIYRSDEGMTLDSMVSLAQESKEPLKSFLIKHSSDTERAFFLSTARYLLPDNRKGEVSENDFIVIIPAFTVSELTAAFQIGFLIFLPFLVIDLLVSNLLLALGMMMMPPSMISLPFKLLLFVAVSGWTQLVHGLVATYV